MTDVARPFGVIAPIRERSEERAFSPEVPSAAELASVFAAARLAPSAGNAQPWRFVLCRRDSESFGAVTAALRSSNLWAAAAPVLIATTVRTAHVHPTKPPKENRLALLELGLAIGNLLAQATALGLIARPLGGFDRTAVRGALAVPDGWELGVLVAVGRPLEADRLGTEESGAAEAPRERLGVGEIVFEDVWGRGPTDPSAALSEPQPGEPGRRR